MVANGRESSKHSVLAGAGSLGRDHPILRFLPKFSPPERLNSFWSSELLVIVSEVEPQAFGIILCSGFVGISEVCT